jgi:hypothetical protein
MSASEAIEHEWIQTRAHAPSEDLITEDVSTNLYFFLTKKQSTLTPGPAQIVA